MLLAAASQRSDARCGGCAHCRGLKNAALRRLPLGVLAARATRERAAGYGVSARVVSTCIAASPARLVLFATAHTRVSTARRRAVAARAGAASKVALARNRRAMPRAGLPADEGSAAP
jgi:hypothetical protein